MPKRHPTADQLGGSHAVAGRLAMSPHRAPSATEHAEVGDHEPENGALSPSRRRQNGPPRVGDLAQLGLGGLAAAPLPPRRTPPPAAEVPRAQRGVVETSSLFGYLAQLQAEALAPPEQRAAAAERALARSPRTVASSMASKNAGSGRVAAAMGASTAPALAAARAAADAEAQLAAARMRAEARSPSMAKRGALVEMGPPGEGLAHYMGDEAGMRVALKARLHPTHAQRHDSALGALGVAHPAALGSVPEAFASHRKHRSGHGAGLEAAGGGGAGALTPPPGGFTSLDSGADTAAYLTSETTGAPAPMFGGHRMFGSLEFADGALVGPPQGARTFVQPDGSKGERLHDPIFASGAICDAGGLGGFAADAEARGRGGLARSRKPSKHAGGAVALLMLDDAERLRLEEAAVAKELAALDLRRAGMAAAAAERQAGGGGGGGGGAGGSDEGGEGGDGAGGAGGASPSGAARAALPPLRLRGEGSVAAAGVASGLLTSSPMRGATPRAAAAAAAAAAAEEEEAPLTAAAAGAAVYAEAAVRTNAFGREPAHFRMGEHSRAAVHAAARGLLPPDNARMRVVRAALRERLPKDARAAALALRHKLGLRDGDGDGVLRDEELLGALIDLAPTSLTASDVGHVALLLRSNARAAAAGAGADEGGAGGAADDESVPVLSVDGAAEAERDADAGAGAGAGAGGGPGVDRGPGVGVAAVAAWLLGIEGGTEATAFASRSPIVTDAHRAGVREEGVAEKVGGAAAASRLDYASAGTAYVLFRAGWERRHGAPARKEAALDDAIGADGPTWARAAPQPFRVMRMSGAGAPPAAAAAAPTPPKPAPAAATPIRSTSNLIG